jgi:hypothetical protein
VSLHLDVVLQLPIIKSEKTSEKEKVNPSSQMPFLILSSALAKVVSVGKPDLGGPFVMYDQDGTPVTDATYRFFSLLLPSPPPHPPSEVNICCSTLASRTVPTSVRVNY